MNCPPGFDCNTAIEVELGNILQLQMITGIYLNPKTMVNTK